MAHVDSQPRELATMACDAPAQTAAGFDDKAGALVRVKRALLTVLAIASLGMAVLGAMLPGLPCTEFVLLAAWAATRSSPRLNAWLHAHPRFGPVLHNWRNGRRVPRKAKWAATVSMSVSAAIMLHTFKQPMYAWGLIACMAMVLLWLWRRPLPDASVRPSR